MTKVTLFRSSQGLICGFDCSGHAGYAKAGKDIVCAAVSVLAVTCANALESVAEVRATITMGDGALRVLLTGEQAAVHDAQVILRVFKQGIGDIAKSYPKHIRTEETTYVET